MTTEEAAVLANPDRPQAVNGVRFTAKLTGHRTGLVAGTDWLYGPGVGWLDISGTDEHTDGSGAFYTLKGRIVSATADHILGITDAGLSITLPRALVTESPDE